MVLSELLSLKRYMKRYMKGRQRERERGSICEGKAYKGRAKKRKYKTRTTTGVGENQSLKSPKKSDNKKWQTVIKFLHALNNAQHFKQSLFFLSK